VFIYTYLLFIYKQVWQDGILVAYINGRITLHPEGGVHKSALDEVEIGAGELGGLMNLNGEEIEFGKYLATGEGFVREMGEEEKKEGEKGASVGESEGDGGRGRNQGRAEEGIMLMFL